MYRYLLLDGYISVARQTNLYIPESAYELFYDDIPSYEYVSRQIANYTLRRKIIMEGLSKL